MSKRGAGVGTSARGEDNQGHRPAEYFVVWQEEADANSRAWATRIARAKVRQGKEAVMIFRRSGLRQQTNADGLPTWTWDEDELEEDVCEG